MSYCPMFFQLQQEGFIIRSCITSGFNELIKAHPGEKGHYYSAFFHLAIALERFAKLNMILDHLTCNALRVPGKEVIKQYGHKVTKLYDKAAEIAGRRNCAGKQGFKLSKIQRRMLQFLSNFANGARYANLDALADGVNASDPVLEWSKILYDICKTDVPSTVKDKIISESNELAAAIESMTAVVAFDLDNTPLTVKGVLTNPRLLMEASRYVICHLIEIFYPLRDLLRDLSDEARAINVQQTTAIAYIPDMDEFFEFLWPDKSFSLSKEEWP